MNNDAVRRLRERKKRDEKPFAVMVANLDAARRLVQLGEVEERLLSGPESPVVIVRKAPACPVSELVAPGNGWLGLMLPYTPLHHLLFKGTGGRGQDKQNTDFREDSTLDTGPCSLSPSFSALVMTSANSSDEPIAFEDHDALQRLGGIADAFLTHNRPIHIRSDDSVMRVLHGQPLFYRRARGYTPRTIQLPFACPPLLALGAELKSAVCLVRGERAFLSQHIGDLQNDAVFSSFRNIISHLTTLLEITPEIVACDLHPDYLSSIHAAETGLPLVRVQHHHAHLAACMAENGLSGEVIGMIFDGTGYGGDGTIWGGEFLTGGYEDFQRVAHFRPVRLPGGDAAVREPWRMALSYLYAAIGDAAFAIDHPIVQRLTASERDLLSAVLQRGINAPLTSSCGRLFDAVAALLHVREVVSFDGQAAIELEALAETVDIEEARKSFSPSFFQGGEYTFRIISRDEQPLQLDFSPMFPEILADLKSGVSTDVIAHRFHATVARAAIETCLQIAQSSGLRRVVLSGGVFQNRLLGEMVYTGLTRQGLEVFCHRLTPPNDGCIALGQAVIAGWKTRRNN
jgi:hydrogenase maturation protein HypF